DVELLGGSGTTVCACPGTEADLADGIGPFRALRHAGSPLAVGSDQHAAVDLLAEARLVELHERLASGERGRIAPGALVDALTAHGHACLGWPDAGRIAPGARADLVAVRLDSPRTAGVAPEQVVMAASAADVHTVVADGRLVVVAGEHVLGDVGRLLADALDPIWEEQLAPSSPASPSSSPTIPRSAPGRWGSWPTPRWWSTAAASPGSGRPRRRRPPTPGSTSTAGRCCPASSTATATWCSPGSAPPSSRPGCPACPTTAAASRPRSRPPAPPTT